MVRGRGWRKCSPPSLCGPADYAYANPPYAESAMNDATIKSALDRHWAASDRNEFEAEHDIYHDDAVLDYPQSGERIRSRRNIQESRTVQPNQKRFTAKRMIGSGNL